jgi:hypothetical protein
VKHLFTSISISILFSLSCYAMEPARKTREAQIIPLPGLQDPSAIAFPTQSHVVIGGKNDCILFFQTSGVKSYSMQSIVSCKTFAIDAHKQEGLVVITNKEEIFVYAPRTERIIWSNHIIPEKNIPAIFGPDKTIITLNPADRSVMIFDYEKGLHKERISSCLFNPKSLIFTCPLSCNYEQPYSPKIAYLNDKRQAVIKDLSGAISTKTKESESYKNILLSPYGKYVALAATLGCTIWNPRTDESYEIDDIYKPYDISISGGKTQLYIKSMAFHPNGCLALLTGHMLGHTLKYFNLNKKTLISDEDIPLNKILSERALDISPEGTDVVILGENEFVIAPVPLTVLAQIDAN